jgi:hypothetical protein
MSTGTAHLPYVDEHAVEVAASAEATWEALLRVVERSFEGGATPGVARLLGCAETEASGPRPLAEGSTVPGFRIADARPAEELALAGRHRLSDYALIFWLDREDGTGTRVRAETRAEFPGVRGSIYRTLVIRTRGHVLVTRRLLSATKRRAERP